MHEEFITFTNEGQRLYGMLHLPDGSGPHPAALLLHGITGTRVEPHRMFVKLAREAASRGMVVMRFDFRGEGESEGDFEDMTLLGEVSDTVRALDLLTQRPEVDPDRISVVGLSMGGAITALLAGVDPRPRSVVTMGGVADPIAFFEYYLKQPLPQADYDMGGNLIGKKLFDELRTIDPIASLGRFKGATLVIHGTGDTIVPYEHGEWLYAAAQGHKQLELIPNATHCFDSVAWERQSFDLVHAWWRDTL